MAQVESMNRVSAIIVNWNGAQFLERCLTALMAQSIQFHEIIVLDNASTDDSLSVIRKFPAVRLISLDTNTGFARGNNLAIAESSATSEWIALLNPDVYAEPNWLEELLKAATRHPEYEVFSSLTLNADEPKQVDGAGDTYLVSGRVRRIGHGDRISEKYLREREVFSPCAAAALYKRNAILELDGFDEDFFCYVEDIDLGFRLRLAGYRCLFVPGSVALHVGSGTTGGQHSDFSVYYGHRNLVWTFVKNMPGVLFWILLPLHILLNFLTILWFVLRGRGRIITKSKRDALLGLADVWRKRREVQKKRRVGVAEIFSKLEKRFF